jgi:F-type H+-transporting ATPase subunit b
MRKRFVTILFTATFCLLLPASRLHAQEGAAHPPGATAEAAHAEHESEPLLPDLEAKSTYTEAAWVLIIFIAMLIILYPTAWKNVLAGLKKREERIRNDIAEAEATRAKAEATLKEYNTQLAAAENRIREMLSKATVDGEKLATSIRMKAQSEAEEIKERTQREIESSKDAAINEIYAQAAELSTSIAEKILKRSLNAEDQRALVRESLAQLQSVEIK